MAAVKVMMVIVGETADRSKAKVMRRGPFSKAVIEGMLTPPATGAALLSLLVESEESPSPMTPFESKRPPNEEEEERPTPPPPIELEEGIMALVGDMRELEDAELDNIIPFIVGAAFSKSGPPPPPPPISPPKMSSKLSK